MKTTYKWIALLLFACFSLTLFFGCGVAKTAFYRVVKVLTEFDSFDFSASVHIKDAKNERFLRVYGHAEDAEHIRLFLESKETEDGEYVSMTDVYLIEKTAYINVCGLISQATSAIPNADCYYKLSLNGAAARANLPSDAENQTYLAFARDLFVCCVDFLEKSAHGVDPYPVTKSGSRYSFTINENNAKQLISNFVDLYETEWDKTFDGLIADYRAKGGDYAAFADELKKAMLSRDALAPSQIWIDRIRAEGFSEAFSAVLSVELTGKNGERIFDTEAAFRLPDEQKTVSFTAKIAETAQPVEIVAPEKLLPSYLNEVIETMIAARIREGGS